MKMPGIVVYKDDIELFDGFLDAGEVGKVVMAVIAFNETGEKHIDGFSPLETVLFRLMIRKVGRDGKRYEARVINGRKGGRPAKPNETEQNLTKPNRTEPNLTPETKTESKTKTKTETKTETETVVVFRPPSREAVREYAETTKTTTDPDRFFDYYEARGWELKPGVPIRNWQSVFNIWIKNEGRIDNGNGSGNHPGGGQGDPGDDDPYRYLYDFDKV